MKVSKSIILFQLKITIAFIVGGFLGFTLNDFSPIVLKFVSSPLGTFIIIYLSLFVVDNLTKSRSSTIVSALIFTIILRSLIYGSNYIWAKYKDEPYLKNLMENPIIFSQEPNYKDYIKDDTNKRSLFKGNKSLLGYIFGTD